MQIPGWHSVAKAPETRRIDSNLYAGPRGKSSLAARTPKPVDATVAGLSLHVPSPATPAPCRGATYQRATDKDVVRGVPRLRGRALCGVGSRDCLSQVYASMEADTVDIAFLWKRLLQQLQHLSTDERRRIGVALIVAFHAHAGQLRKSGEPFITHPVEVARILGGLRLDADTIIAGLLHDTVEDTDRLSFEDIEKRFGPQVRRIVEAETRLAKVDPSLPGDSVKDMDFRRFFTCIARDVRVVLVKLADRLHNMRTMESMRPSKQREKATETLQVYAPLAGVLGLDSMKEEMEELSLRYSDPQRYDELKGHLKKLQEMQGASLENARKLLQRELEADPVLASMIKGVKVLSRQKSVYTLYKIYKNSKWNLDQNQALRRVGQLVVVLETTGRREEAARVCYSALGTVHLLWKPIPGRLVDYIATPNPGSWKGIRTTVWPSSGPRLITPVDVLIQTTQMSVGNFAELPEAELPDWMAEVPLVDGWTSPHETLQRTPTNGVSSFRNGTANGTVSNRVEDVASVEFRWNGFNQAQMWADSLQRWQEEVGTDMSPRDYADCIRDEFLSPSVYVFTPAGDFVLLPKGATVLDFAYHIHTDVGNRAVGARVDGCSVGPNHVLMNAQVVEILTNHEWKISQDYLNILRSRISAIKTTSARRKLKSFIKRHSKQLNSSAVPKPVESRPLSLGIPGMEEDPWKACPSESCFWITVDCDDKKGVLSALTEVIARRALNISKLTGDRRTEGSFIVKFHVHDPGGLSAPELSRELEAVEGCRGAVMGCTLPLFPISPLGWHLPNST